MKILIGHNKYMQHGGEDTVVEQEIALLKASGHQVVSYQRSNAEVQSFTPWQKVGLPFRVIWASDTYQQVRELLRREKPDVAHFHNTHFMISPAAYYACQDNGVPVVQTIHNYRLLCPAAQFLRAGRVCEDCIRKRIPWPGILHACYRASRAETTMVAGMLSYHRWRQTWQTQVDRYIVLTSFVREKLIEGGFPAAKMVIKPNSLFPEPEWRGGATPCPGYVLFVGRLSPEKGIDTLLQAWERLSSEKEELVPQLRIIGDGPLAPQVTEAVRRLPMVKWMGPMSRSGVLSSMRGASAIICPSIWYEGLPLVVLEAFACGLPVIASNLGNLGVLIESGRTGLHFRPGDVGDLVQQVIWMATHPDELRQMGIWARAEFELKYTAQRNYENLMRIYESVLTPSHPSATPART